MPFVATAATLSFFCVVLSARSVDSHTAGCPVYLGWKHHRTSMRGVRFMVCAAKAPPPLSLLVGSARLLRLICCMLHASWLSKTDAPTGTATPHAENRGGHRFFCHTH
jgi:hypothetical protein